jgi:hypothetical protein
MNPLIQLKQTTAVFLLAFGLACFALSPKAQAVLPSPTPDGGYPGKNTAEGQNALLNLNTSSGIDNTAVGWSSLKSVTTGTYNTAVGSGALFTNTASGNTAIGAAALFRNTTGNGNTATGLQALYSNTTGNSNTAVGHQALYSNTIGSVNPTTGNTALGYQSLFSNTTVGGNTAVGAGALYSNTTGNPNTASGVMALYNNTTGLENTADGGGALYFNTTGGRNTAVGENSLVGNTTGSNTVALGYLAGYNATTGSNNVYIGANIQGVAAESNACYIASVYGRTSGDGIPVYINSQNKLGTRTSSKRFKEDIKPMGDVSEALYLLKPIAFRYKKEIDPNRKRELGLLAEDVEKVNSDLVVRDKEGKPYTVRYDAINAMLLNEFLKEHQKVQELEKQVEKLTAGLQKVSAQLEASKPAPQVVNNP